MLATKNNVIVKRIAGSKETDSGIILKTSQEPDKATVINTGPDVLEVNQEDIVLLDWNRAVDLHEDDKYIVSEDYIIAVL